MTANITTTEINKLWSGEQHVGPLALFLTGLSGFVGVFGNALTIVVGLSSPNLRKFSYILLYNLALSDLTSSSCYLLYDLILSSVEARSNLVCKLWESEWLFMASLMVSPLTMIATMIDRYLAVGYPILYRNKLQKKQVYAAIFCWCFAIGWSMLYLPYISYVPEHETCIFEHTDDIKLIGGGWTLIMYYIPMIASSIFAYKIHKTLKAISANTTTGVTASSQALSRKVHRIMVAIVIAYGLCYAGTAVLSPLALMGVVDHAWYVRFEAYNSAMRIVNSWTNPILYFGINKDFRQNLRRLLHLGQEIDPAAGTLSTNHQLGETRQTGLAVNQMVEGN